MQAGVLSGGDLGVESTGLSFRDPFADLEPHVSRRRAHAKRRGKADDDPEVDLLGLVALEPALESGSRKQQLAREVPCLDLFKVRRRAEDRLRLVDDRQVAKAVMPELVRESEALANERLVPVEEDERWLRRRPKAPAIPLGSERMATGTPAQSSTTVRMSGSGPVRPRSSSWRAARAARIASWTCGPGGIV